MSPTVRRRRLASELRRLREAAELTCEDVAARLECSASKISRIETGRVLASPRDVRDLLAIYDAPDEQRESLIQLARDARQKGWWHDYRDSVQPHWATYLGMEGMASELRQHSVIRIPALLQTEDYARAVITSGRMGRSEPGADRAVELLMERQRQASVTPPKVWAVLDEAALRRQVGGREIMRQQIEHLMEASSKPGMLLQFIPNASGAHPAMDLPFVIMTYADPADPEIVCVGYATGMLWIEDTAEVDQYTKLFHHLQAAALSPGDSTALMISVLKEM